MRAHVSNPTRRRCMITLVIASLGWLLITQNTFAGEYPTKLIKIIVPFPPGGSNDVQARLIAKGLSERLGNP